MKQNHQPVFSTRKLDLEVTKFFSLNINDKILKFKPVGSCLLAENLGQIQSLKKLKNTVNH